MLEIQPNELVIVKTILQKHVPNHEVRVFGSRTKGKAKKYSDLDLVIMGNKKIPREILFALKEDFEESDLPFRVDILDWHRVSAEFQQVIQQQSVAIN